MIDISMFNADDIRQYLVIPIIVFCFIMGYVIKHYTNLPNKYIPLVMLILGTVINVGITVAHTSSVTFITILGGAISGLSSCGFYDMITAKMGLSKDTSEKDEDPKQ